jgi:microcystin-dependent protein
MAKNYAELIRARLEQVGGTLATIAKGLIYYNTSNDRPYVDDGVSAREVMLNENLPEARRATKVQLDDTDTGNEIIGTLPYQKGGTGIDTLTGEKGKALVVNKTEDGWEFGTSGQGVPSMFKILNAEEESVGDWTVSGTTAFTFDTTDVLNGDTTYKCVLNAINDSVTSPNITVPERSREKVCGLSFPFQCDVVGADIKILDVTNGDAELVRGNFTVNNTNTGTMELFWFMPANTATIKIEIEAITFTGSQTIFFDDMVFDDEPLSKKSLQDENNFSARISNNGAVSLTSENLSFIDSVVRNGPGDVTVNFKSGFFSVLPYITLKADDTSIHATPSSLSLNSVRVYTTEANATNGFYDRNFTIMASRQGSDYKEYTDSVVVTRDDSDIGSIQAFGTDTAPNNYLYCDGSTVSRSIYSDLFDTIGTNFGSGDGSTTFHLPDFRGNFARGQDDGVGNDPDAGSRVASNSGGNTGDNVGSWQDDQYKSHTHGFSINGGTNANAGANPRQFHSTSTYWNTSSFTTNGSGGNETRPNNVNVRYYIKWRSTDAIIVPTADLTENNFSARVQHNGGSPIVSSQNQSWIQSVSFNVDEYIVTFVPGFFSSAPGIVVQGAANGDVRTPDEFVIATASSVTIRFKNNNAVLGSIGEFNIWASRQGSDYNEKQGFLLVGGDGRRNKYQEKTLSGNVAASGVMTELTFNNLEIGKIYRVTFLADWQGTSNKRVDIDNDGTNIGLVIQESTAELKTTWTRIFKAVGTQLTFKKVDSNGQIQSTTYSTLEELSDYVETTDWT